MHPDNHSSTTQPRNNRCGKRAWTRSQVALLVLGAVGVGCLALGPFADFAGASERSAAPKVVILSNQRTISRWAYPQAAAVVRASPSTHARAVGKLRFLTPDGLGQAQIYMALREERMPRTGVTWIEVPVPARPNGVVGWVPASALGPLNVVYGELVVNREALTATLYNRTGHAIWSARVGTGRPSLPTPAGHFYVLEKLQAIGGPVYGPYALATSAYAPSLSEWPGGGVVGIHGTDQPQLIPGYPSHGCVRMRNNDITTLWHLIKLGTPIDIK